MVLDNHAANGESNPDKYAIIEYLKAATYDNYPSAKRAYQARMPCEGDRDWTNKPEPAAR
jgi:hypothetical protein